MGLPKTGLAPHLTPISYRDESDYRNTDHNQLAGDGRTRRWVAPLRLTPPSLLRRTVPVVWDLPALAASY
jgi:hypothetical protein